MTLVEVLVVVLIIALLMGIFYPVLVSVRKRAHESTCLSNLRQLGAAWLMYTQDYGDYPPSILTLHATGYVKSKELYQCPADRFRGSNFHYTRRFGAPVSYSDIFEGSPDFPLRSVLRSVDPNHGIIACDLHGEPWRDVVISSVNLDGKTFRVINDGSIKVVRVETHCYRRGDSIVLERNPWRLLSDLPCPPLFCLPGERVPCY